MENRIQPHAFLIKYAEIGIKGKNRHMFEDALIHHIVRVLHGVEGRFSVTKEFGRIYVRPEGAYDDAAALDALQCVFGISGICPVEIVDDLSWDNLAAAVVSYMQRHYPENGAVRTFKINARRSNRSYPKDSMQLNADLGEAVLYACPWMKVDVHHPEIELTVEVRDQIYLYAGTVPGPGGMPVGSNGKAMLLLSGGIDSPVAGYMIAKRGIHLDAV